MKQCHGIKTFYFTVQVNNSVMHKNNWLCRIKKPIFITATYVYSRIYRQHVMWDRTPTLVNIHTRTP